MFLVLGDCKFMKTAKLCICSTIIFALFLFLNKNIYTIVVHAETQNGIVSGNSLEYYGAKGDGVSDDTIAINNALSACAGSTLYIPSGTYMISGQISIPSNTRIIGTSDNSIFMAVERMPVGSDLFIIRNARNISIQNISISGNILKNSRQNGHSDKDGIHLLDIWNSSSIDIKGCNFLDNVYAAIRLIQTNSSINVDKCNFINIDCGIAALGDGNIDQLTVSNSLFDGHENSEPITLYGSNTSKYTNINILYNTMKNKTYGTSICFARGTFNNLSIIGNKLYDNAVGIYISNATNVDIGDNIIDFSGLINKTGGAGIAIVNCSSISIHDNNISKIRQQGLLLRDCSSTTVTNNKITDCGYLTNDYHALDLRGKCTDMIILGNSFTRNDLSLSDCFLAVNCSGSLKIIDNKFVNCKINIYGDTSDLTVSGK